MSTEIRTVEFVQVRSSSGTDLSQYFSYGFVRSGTSESYHYGDAGYGVLQPKYKHGMPVAGETAVNISVNDRTSDKPPVSEVTIDGVTRTLIPGRYESGEIKELFGEKAGRQAKSIRIY